MGGCVNMAQCTGCTGDYYHHHCSRCGVWQFGSAKSDEYGGGRCYSCAVHVLNWVDDNPAASFIGDEEDK